MKYALVSIGEVKLETSHWVTEGKIDRLVFETKTYPANTISNLIVYDGVAPYSPPTDFYLASVPDDTQIGDPYLE
jgi:hypothetical protein